MSPDVLEPPGPNAEQAAFWEDRAPSWIASSEWWLGVVTGPFADATIDRLEPTPGGRYLDVGCGTGPMSIALARAIEPDGVVEGVDIAPSMVVAAQANATEAGVGGITCRVATVQVARLGQDLLAGVVSQFGVMFFADPVAAFTNLRSAMKSGATLSFCCWQALGDNEWMMAPGAAAVAVTGWLPDLPAPDAPGPFAFADANRVDRILSDAGFGDVDLLDVRATVEVPEDRVGEAVVAVSRMGMVREQLLHAPDEPARAAVLDAVHADMTGRLDGGTVRLGAAGWAVRATA